MALDTKKAASFLKSGVTVVSVYCYRFVREHPFFSSLLCSLGVLYVCYPKVFFFLISSSPVLVSTALLLGTLLSLGQPHIPQIDDLIEEEEENLKVSSKALEDDKDEKKRGNNIIKELSGDDDAQLQRTDDDDDDVVTDVPVTKVSRRRFEEGIDDVSARGYIDAETLLGRRTEIVETIEEEEEQFNVEDLDDSDDRVRNNALAESVDFIPTHKREVEEVAAVENKEEATVIDESNIIVETSVEKEQENIVHKEEISEKTGEEGAEGHVTECEDKKEETEMENLAKSVNFSDTDTMIERSLENPLKEIEEEMPLLGHLNSSTREIHEEVFQLRTVDMDSSEGTSKSKGFNGKAEDTVEGEPQVVVSDDVEDNAHNASLENLYKLELRSSWKRFAHRHSPSDSGSDAAESLSSDASLGQLDPMFDEHHPLLAYEGSKAGSVSNSSIEEGFHAEEFSPREMVPEGFIAFPNELQAPSDVHEEEEEEEEEVPNDFGFTWTEEDEKNLRNLGLSEWERIQQEERLIADLHVQHSQGAQEENLIDFYSEERTSFLEEENLVEIGVAGETAAEKAIAIHSDSVDHQLQGQTESASKEIPLEAQFDSMSREIPVKVQSVPGYEEATTEVQFDQVCKENPTELPEEKSLIDHLDKCTPNDLELLEDQGQPSGDACLDETHQEMMQVEVGSIEEIESASRSVIVEDTANNHEQIQVCSPKDSLQSIEKVEVAMQDSSTEFQMHGESIHADAASVEEERLKSQKNIVLDDDLSSSSSSADEIKMSAPETTAEESETVHEEFGVSSPKDSRHHNKDVEANEVLSVPVTEILRESIDTVAEVLSTEEDESEEEEGKEPSDDSSSSASENIETTTMEVMVGKSAITDEEIQVVSPKASLESTEMIETSSEDASVVMEVLRDDLTTVAEEAFSGNQHEKMEAVYDDSSSSATSEIDLATRELIAEESVYKHDMAQVESLEIEEQATETVEAIDLATRELIAEESAYKHDIAQVESLKAAEQATETVEAIEKDSGLEIEAHRDMASTEEQQPKEEKIENHFDDSSSSASEETESTANEFIQEELPSKLEEIHDVSPKISHGSIEIMEAVEMGSLPVVDMLGDSLPTAEQEELSEAQGSKSEEPNEPSDNLGFSATNLAISENQEGLIILDVKSKEELESAFKHMVSNELDSIYEESHLVSPKANQESTATVEQVKKDSTLQMHMPRDGFGEDASSEERQPMPDATENSSDDSSSSASDISSFERLEELTSLEVNSKEQIEAALKEAIASASDISSFERLEELNSLEVNSKEQIEAALKEAIAEELAHTHEEVEVSSSKASERHTETVEPTKLDFPPVMDMQRNISPSATLGASSTEEHQSKPEKTEESCDDLNSAEMEVRKSPFSDGGEIQ